VKSTVVNKKIFICVYNPIMQQTRQRVLDYLEQRGSATARQLAQAFDMTSANLRRHLSILQKDGLIVGVVGKLQNQGRGRPDHLYALSAEAKTDLNPLTRALLRTLDFTEMNMKKLTEALLGNGTSPKGQITQRLVSAVRSLEPLGYKPRWEARPQGPQMVFGRCPYAAIIADHPELCRMDVRVLEELLAVQVEQTAKLQPGPQHVPQCVFQLQQVSQQSK
jgi:predicted ArsR family transcriptional regulator